MSGNREIGEIGGFRRGRRRAVTTKFIGSFSGDLTLFPKSTFGKETRVRKKFKLIINASRIIQAKNVTRKKGNKTSEQ